MIKRTFILNLIAAFALVTITHAQTAKPKDFVNVAGPLTFDNKLYNLDWSSNPSANFYKQEYLVKGDIAGKYKTMLLIDVLVTAKTVKEIAASKIEELKVMKQTNPIVNYEIFDNPTTGDYMIDFVLSANGADGKVSIVERNVYRYKTFTDKAGKKGVFLFGVSTRAYGNNVTAFLTALKTTKSILVNAVAKYTLPEITIK